MAITPFSCPYDSHKVNVLMKCMHLHCVSSWCGKSCEQITAGSPIDRTPLWSEVLASLSVSTIHFTSQVCLTSVQCRRCHTRRYSLYKTIPSQCSVNIVQTVWTAPNHSVASIHSVTVLSTCTLCNCFCPFHTTVCGRSVGQMSISVMLLNH